LKKKKNRRPDDVFGLAADELEVQLESEAVQREVPKAAQPPHLVGEGPHVGVAAHVQRGESLQQADLSGDLTTGGGAVNDADALGDVVGFFVRRRSDRFT